MRQIVKNALGLSKSGEKGRAFQVCRIAEAKIARLTNVPKVFRNALWTSVATVL